MFTNSHTNTHKQTGLHFNKLSVLKGGNYKPVVWKLYSKDKIILIDIVQFKKINFNPFMQPFYTLKYQLYFYVIFV